MLCSLCDETIDYFNSQVFAGNPDAITTVTRWFPYHIWAKKVRIHPTAWNNHIAMRFEILGCEGKYGDTK